MAKKDETKKAAAADTTTADDKPAASPLIDNSGLEALSGKTIDERMAALLEDHKRMGAR